MKQKHVNLHPYTVIMLCEECGGECHPIADVFGVIINKVLWECEKCKNQTREDESLGYHEVKFKRYDNNEDL